MSSSLLLYIHVPFCRSKCGYCAFASQALTSEQQWDAYAQSLLKEMVVWSDILDRPAISTLFFGGGTPSLMPVPVMEELVKHVHKLFRTESDLEFTFEANPDSAGQPDLLRAWRRAGATRLSLGVQSFNEANLKLLGRPHTASQAWTAGRLALDAGFKINLDLIWGLPGQSVTAWLAELKNAVELGPHHLSCYGLTLEPGTPLFTSLDQASLPAERDQALMYVRGGEYLESEGFFQYEISNYSRLGLNCRHNQGYWQGLDYLGLGPSAVSTIGGLRRKNPSALAAWMDTAGDRASLLQGERLSPEEKIREYIMLSLRTSQGLDLDQLAAISGKNLLAEQARLLAGLKQHGLVKVLSGRLILTRAGMVVSNSIIARLMDF